jgi:uncharacterized integral membrane protein
MTTRRERGAKGRSGKTLGGIRNTPGGRAMSALPPAGSRNLADIAEIAMFVQVGCIHPTPEGGCPRPWCRKRVLVMVGNPQEPLQGRSRLGGLWVVLTAGAVVLVLLLVFILQNGQRVQIHLYGAHWNAPLGVALLMAAALGVLLVLVPGAGRIIQLRRTARSLHQDRERLRDQVPQDSQPAVGQAPGQGAQGQAGAEDVAPDEGEQQ